MQSIKQQILIKVGYIYTYVMNMRINSSKCDDQKYLDGFCAELSGGANLNLTIAAGGQEINTDYWYYGMFVKLPISEKEFEIGTDNTNSFKPVIQKKYLFKYYQGDDDCLAHFVGYRGEI